MENRTPIFTSFYTADYMATAARLVRSLRQFGLEFSVERVAADETWTKTCCKRARWIAQALDANRDRPVVWLDADCAVYQRPQIFFDLAATPEGRRYDIAYFRRPYGLIGGVIYAEQSSRELWDMMEDREGDEDVRMQLAIDAWTVRKGHPLRIYPLPHTYHYVPWLMGTIESPLPQSEWVIVHGMEHSGKAEGRL